MKLYFSATSPFVRKVMLAAHEKGIAERIEHIAADGVSDTNPLGKVPALITDEGVGLFDSFVICDYLDRLAERPRLIPLDAVERTRVLRLHAIADGIMEAGVACVTEWRRPEDKQWEAFAERQQQKVRRAVDALEPAAETLGEAADLATLSVGAALGYVDFRLGQRIDWREGHPGLSTWYESFSQRPSMRSTVPPG